MKMKFLVPCFLAVFTCFSQALFAQTPAKTVKGATLIGTVVESKMKKPLEAVGISLLSAKDSSGVIHSTTNKEGHFSLPGIKAGNYVLKLSFVGFKTIMKPLSIPDGQIISAGTIELEEGILLNAVVLETEPIPVKVVNDTTEFNTGAFKAAPDATVEDGLKRLPGVEVDKDGNIKHNDEAITRVTVDGKAFFGNDPKIATKNLPYDAIAKVRIIDDKTDQAKATGIDDGKRVKTMDLVLKDDKKKGYFGSGSLAGGTESKYLGSGSINRFTKTKQFNVLLLTNNVNQTGFTSEEASNFGSGNGSYSSASIDQAGNISQTINGVNVGNATSGLTNTKSGGANYADVFGKKKKGTFNVNYFGTLSNTMLESDQSVQQTQLSGTFFNHSNSNNNNKNQSHRITSRVYAPIDSLTSLNINPTFSLTNSNSISSRIFSQDNDTHSPVNSGSSQSTNKSNRPGIDGNLSLSRRLHNRKGTLSTYIYGSYNPTSYDNINQSENNFYNTKPSILINRLEDQDQTSGYIDASLNLSRTLKTRTVVKDPVTAAMQPTPAISNPGAVAVKPPASSGPVAEASAKAPAAATPAPAALPRPPIKYKGTDVSFSLSPTYNLNVGNSDRSTIEYDPATGLYSRRLDSLTNNTISKTTRIGTGMGLSLSRTKWNLSLNGNLSNIHLNGSIADNKSFNEVNKNYFSFTPSFNATYRFKTSRSLSMNASASTSPPSVSYLMVKQNNTSPLYISVGNPDLKVSSSYYGSLRYSSSDAKRRTNTSISASFNKSFNTISRNSIFDSNTGITTSKPLNINGNYRFSVTGSYSIPTKVTGLRIAPGLSFNNSRNVSFLNSVKNNSDQTGGGANLSFSYANKETLTLSYTNRTAYTHINNSARATLTNNYINMDNSASISLVPLKNWRLVSDFTHRRAGGQSFLLLNAGLQRYVMSNNRMLLELRGFDLLNKNTDVVKYSSDTQISETRNNNIRQYFYMKLTYKINKIGGGKTVPPPTMEIYRF